MKSRLSEVTSCGRKGSWISNPLLTPRPVIFFLTCLIIRAIFIEGENIFLPLIVIHHMCKEGLASCVSPLDSMLHEGRDHALLFIAASFVPRWWSAQCTCSMNMFLTNKSMSKYKLSIIM